MIKFLTYILIFSLLPIQAFSAQFDHIKKVLIYETDSNNYLILHEIHLRITDGSYEKGNERASGFTESKIRVLDINTGQFIAEKYMGNMDSTAACALLGISNNRLWIYWKKNDSGLQALNPVSLEKEVSQAQIYSKMLGETGTLVTPDQNNITENYSFNPFTNQLMVSNVHNEKYYLDPENFEVTPFKEGFNLKPEKNLYLTGTTTYKDSTLSISSRHNGLIQVNYKSIKSDKYYKEGYFILEQNPTKLYNYFNNRLKNNRADSSEVLKNIDALINGRKADEVLLNAEEDSNIFYVLHRNNAKPDAIAKISKVEMMNWQKVQTNWSTLLHAMFWDISEARNTRTFKKLYPIIIPNPNYRFFEISNNRLVIIYLKQITCLNTFNGDVVWRQRL